MPERKLQWKLLMEVTPGMKQDFQLSQEAMVWYQKRLTNQLNKLPIGSSESSKLHSKISQLKSAVVRTKARIKRIP